MESGSDDSSPILRVTTDISEVKDNGSTKDPSNKSLSGRDYKAPLLGNAKKRILQPIYGCNPYQGRNNFCSSYHVSIQNAKSNVSAFTQRIMSAKLLRVKQLQNQLAESQSKVTELINENKLLKNLQRRQDSALKRYEGSQEQLPQLIKSHNEEMRIINSKFKQVKLNYRLLENKLKERDTELFNLKEQHKHLLKLSRDKQLCDREKLTKKLEEMETKMAAQQDKIQMLNRKIELEQKSYRHRLNLEINKHKETQSELRESRKIIETMKSIEGKQKFLNTSLPNKIKRPVGHANQQSRISLPANPPNVSIRQPQRLAFSETALNRQEESDSDSFSFDLQNLKNTGGGDETSDQSDSNEDENPEVAEENFILMKSGNTIASTKFGFENSNRNESNNVLTSVPNIIGKKILSQPRNVLSSNTKTFASENKFGTKFNVMNQSKLSHKNEKEHSRNITEFKVPDPAPSLRNVSRRNSISSTVPLMKNKSKTLNRRQSVASKLFEKSGSVESLKPNKITQHDDPAHIARTPSTEDISIANPYDQELSTMQTEIEKELEKMYQNPPENELVSEPKDHFASGSTMDAAIEELERKFKIFDMPQIRKEAEDDINRIVDRACMGLLESEAQNSDSEIKSNIPNIKVTNEVDDDFLNKLENCYKEVDVSQADIALGESQKADLLKALDNIDKESNTNLSTYFQSSNEELNTNSYKKVHGYPQVTNVISSNGKNEGIKELFNEESTAVSTK